MVGAVDAPPGAPPIAGTQLAAPAARLELIGLDRASQVAAFEAALEEEGPIIRTYGWDGIRFDADDDKP